MKALEDLMRLSQKLKAAQSVIDLIDKYLLDNFELNQEQEEEKKGEQETEVK